MKSLFRWKRDTSGATAVEFAFVAPVYLLFMFGIFQGGLMLWMQSGLQHAAEQAARCASVNSILCGTTSQVQAYAASQALNRGLSPNSFTRTVTGCGNQVRGSATTEFMFLPIRLTASSCFPI